MERKDFVKKLMIVFLMVTVFSGCATTTAIRNNKKTLGMKGTNVETINPDVATAEIKRGKIIITPIAEGSAMLFVSNLLAEIAIINIVVLETGETTINRIARYIDQPASTILTNTTWSSGYESGSETIQFISGTKGKYTFSDSSGVPHSMNFSYRISENEIEFIFTLTGIMITTGTFSEDTMTLLSIADDEHQISLEFTRTGIK